MGVLTNSIPVTLPPSLMVLFPFSFVNDTLVLFAVYIVTLVVYRLYLHPLAKHPGPFWGKVTDWYSVYHAYIGDRHLALYKAHQKYGPVVRFAPNTLSFNTASGLKTIYGHTAAAKHFAKGDFYRAFPAVPGVHNTHNSVSKIEHGRKRRVLSAAFSDVALKGVEPLVISQIDTFMSVLRASAGSGLDMGEVFSWLTFDVMGELCFGKTFGMLMKPDQRFVTGLIDTAAHNHGIMGTYLPLKTLGLGRVLFPSIVKDRWKFILHSRGCADERMKMERGVKKDFFYYLLDAVDPETGHKFSTKELWGEANVLMIAGSDTTGTGLSALLFYLCRNPDKLEKLRNEVHSAFGSVDDIVAGKELNDCHYLKACCDEALRLAPPVPGLLPREVVGEEGATIDGVHVPQGTVVGTPIYAVQHHPDYFPDPFAFKPERWLGDEAAVEKARSAFTPFSIGSRGCIGKGVAYMEMRLTMARLLKGFKPQLQDVADKGDRWEAGWAEKEGELRLMDHFTSRKEGPMVAFEPIQG